MTSVINKMSHRLGHFDINNHLLVAGATVMVAVASCVWYYLPRCPKAYRDRLKGPQKAYAEDNVMNFADYQTEDYWSETNTLKYLNSARVPYFDEVWKTQLSADQLKSKEKLTMLDVGCGGGIATEPLARLGWNMVGIDPAESGVNVARRHAARNGVKNLEYKQGSAYALPFDDEHFDGVVSSDVLEHLEDVPSAVREIFRVLKPGGIFTFDTVNRTIWSWYHMILMPDHFLGIVPKNCHDWRMFITPEELRIALQDAGFELEEKQNPEWRGMRSSLSPLPLLWKVLKHRSVKEAVQTDPWRQLGPDTIQGLKSSYLGWARKPAKAA